jgi:hypothetical protein
MSTSPTHNVCPECQFEFPFRSNKRFCSPTCRKASAQKKDRANNPANAENSISVRQDQSADFDLALRMAETLYTMPPNQRLGYIEYIVQLARSGKCPRLRRILTNPDLIKPDPEKKYLFYRGLPKVYCTLSQAANRYALFSPWGTGVAEVVRGIAPEPDTGEVKEDRVLAA